MKILKAITALLFIAVMATMFAVAFDAPVLPIFGGLVLCSLFMPKQVAFMAVTKEIWENDVEGNLFKDNQAAERTVNASQYVNQGRLVHIPRAAPPSKSIINPTQFPIDAVQRQDDDISYVLDNIAQPPKFVQGVEQAELSYDKRQSIMGEQQAQLIQDANDRLRYRWGWQDPSQGTNPPTIPGNFILTTGNAVPATLDGATGNRKAFTEDLVGMVKVAMDRKNINPNGRIAELTADAYQQFLNSLSDAARTNFYRYVNMEKGIIGMHLGFTFFMRSTVQRWRSIGGVLQPVDTQAANYAPDPTDCAGSVFWQEQALERAVGEVNVFENAGRAEYFGDVMSMNMRLGGRQRRADGVITIVEAAA